MFKYVQLNTLVGPIRHFHVLWYFASLWVFDEAHLLNSDISPFSWTEAVNSFKSLTQQVK